jgi:CBS domain-containing protein
MRDQRSVLDRVPPSRVADVMTPDVVTAEPWTDLADLVEVMRDRGIRSVPVARTATRSGQWR